MQLATRADTDAGPEAATGCNQLCNLNPSLTYNKKNFDDCLACLQHSAAILFCEIVMLITIAMNYNNIQEQHQCQFITMRIKHNTSDNDYHHNELQ
jgi:hypothetical protein